MASHVELGRGSAAGIALMGLALSVLAQCCMGATYNVGDSQGWNQNVNYNTWASQYTFQVGDTLVFTYSGSTHSVLQVSQTDLAACNINTPLRSYSSGRDSVTLTNATTYYFVCGTLGHCSSGMALTVSVTRATVSPSAAPILSPTPTPTIAPAPTKPPTPTPAPTPNIAPSARIPSSAPISHSPASSHSPVKAPTPSTSSATLRYHAAAIVGAATMGHACICLLLLL